MSFFNKFESRIFSHFSTFRYAFRPKSLSFTLAFGGATIATALAMKKKKVDCCGIFAYVGSEPAVDFLLEGLLVLQNRGYDSAGVGTISPDNQIVVTKYASRGTTSDSLALLQKEAPMRHANHKIGIAHTRWATMGGKTDRNSHPHLDASGRVALVHNGTIENYFELKHELEEKNGIHFSSECDTEVIAQLIGVNINQGMNPTEATHAAISRLHGTYGLAILFKDQPDTIIATCHGSPIAIGLGDGCSFVSSEWVGFRRWTSRLVKLQDGEFCVVTPKGVQGIDLTKMITAPEEKIEISPAPYPHWTIREIMGQPAAIDRSLNGGGRIDIDNRARLGGLESHINELLPIQNLVIAACGTSYHAGIYGAQLMRWLDSFTTVQLFDAAEMIHDNFPKVAPGLLVISQSGETKDVHRAVKLAEEYGIPRFSVVNAVGSLIATSTGVGVYLNAGREYAVASTKAFTTQITVLALIATWFSQNRFSPHRIQSDSAQDCMSPLLNGGRIDLPVRPPSRLLPNGSGNLQKRMQLTTALFNLSELCRHCIEITHQTVKNIAQKIYKKNHCFVLGKGFAEGIAKEGALKIKEICYIVAEGYNGGALKHGPFSLIEEGTPVILIILDDQHAPLMQIATSEVHGRGGHTIVITDKHSLAQPSFSDDVIVIPTNGPLTALLAIVPLQLLAYEIAVLRGIDMDRPRNLAKTITVD